MADQRLKKSYEISLMAPWAVAAAVACFFGGLTGSATAGIAKFLGGRAFIPVAFALFVMLVGLTACAGMFSARCAGRYRRLSLVGFL
jgi:hypothetical protein